MRNFNYIQTQQTFEGFQNGTKSITCKLQLKPYFFKYSKSFLVAVPLASLLRRKEVKLQVSDETPQDGSNKQHLNICFS